MNSGKLNSIKKDGLEDRAVAPTASSPAQPALDSKKPLDSGAISAPDFTASIKTAIEKKIVPLTTPIFSLTPKTTTTSIGLTPCGSINSVNFETYSTASWRTPSAFSFENTIPTGFTNLPVNVLVNVFQYFTEPELLRNIMPVGLNFIKK